MWDMQTRVLCLVIDPNVCSLVSNGGFHLVSHSSGCVVHWPSNDVFTISCIRVSTVDSAANTTSGYTLCNVFIWFQYA